MGFDLGTFTSNWELMQQKVMEMRADTDEEYKDLMCEEWARMYLGEEDYDYSPYITESIGIVAAPVGFATIVIASAISARANFKSAVRDMFSSSDPASATSAIAQTFGAFWSEITWTPISPTVEANTSSAQAIIQAAVMATLPTALAAFDGTMDTIIDLPTIIHTAVSIGGTAQTTTVVGPITTPGVGSIVSL